MLGGNFSTGFFCCHSRVVSWIVSSFLWQLFNYSSVTFSRDWNLFLVSIVKLVWASRFLRQCLRGDKIVTLCMLRRKHFWLVSVNRFNTLNYFNFPLVFELYNFLLCSLLLGDEFPWLVIFCLTFLAIECCYRLYPSLSF